MTTKLILENGITLEGVSFGYNKSVSGEVVFSTNMMGYPESLTDPSFCRQMLCLTYPLVGNYGVPNTEEVDENQILTQLESNKIWIGALIISDYSEFYNHYLSEKSLKDWLIENKIPAIHSVDTRYLTQILRTEGSLKAKIEYRDEKIDFLDINTFDLVKEVSTKTSYTLGKGNIHICVVDCGIKLNILRNLIAHNFKITVVPYDYDYNNDEYDGIFISNGPGNPSKCQKTINNLKNYISKDNAKPVFGICLGNQLLGLASGAKTYKMKYGNRGFNQPVYIKNYDKTFITSQNHGFAIDKNSLTDDWYELCYNKNDKTNEGIQHKSKPFRSVQFHPEARGGPFDTLFLFKEFYDECCDIKYGKIINNKILLLGSGGLSIGQAGEFDYSGSQAIKSYKNKGYQVILVNPNIATIQTSEGFADEVYYIPVEKDFIEKVIIKERPKFISLAFGGQTALNCGIDLFKSGILHKYNVEVIGTSIDNILKTEDRDLFSKEMTIIGEQTPKSMPATNIEEAIEVAQIIGYPVLVRAAFTLGGLGSGFCSDESELRSLLEKTFTKTNQVLIDEDLRGWKEVEYEVMRDMYGNSITICNMENFDPLGIHTGDSIVVAPSQTLNNDEFNMLRSASLKIANKLGIIGECNVQIALDPFSKVYKIIEVNPRLSRSSALASKATGYPIASVAAELCLGEKLHSITNVVTGNTTANFEPSLDYIVVKIPKWETRKFPGVDRHLGSAMKSVGEIMAIGRNFEEAFQKGLRMVSGRGFESYGETPTDQEIKIELNHPTDDRIRILAYTILNNKMDMETIYNLTKIDKWFLSKLFNIKLQFDTLCNTTVTKNPFTKELLSKSKKLGFSDKYISEILNVCSGEIRDLRRRMGINICVKQIDTLAAEFESQTNYLYTTYLGSKDDTCLEVDDYQKKKIIVLGSGKYTIGSSVEFDYCSVKCSEILRKLGYEVIMINYNPETMSTDFDNSDKLYFEELSLESVLDIYHKENVYGIIVSMGGQEPNNIAVELEEAGANILGTSTKSIDTCENRYLFSTLLDKLNITQPNWITATNAEQINNFIIENNYPVLVRPSYVLSGAAMRVVHNKHQMESCLSQANIISPKYPIVITKFYQNCKEIDVDAVSNNGNLICYSIAEHLENAGVHSGDATLILPTININDSVKEKILDIIRKIGIELNIKGLFNTQFLVRDDGWVGVIETNLRASRSIPFVSKTLDIDFIKNAVESILDQPQTYIGTRKINYFGVKTPQFSFNRLSEADPILGVEMKSTGEVASYGKTLQEAYLKSLTSSRCGIKNKDIYTILVLDNTDTSVLQKKGHVVLKYHDSINWKNIDITIDCNCLDSTKHLRRKSIDFSIYLTTNLQQVELLSKSLGTVMASQPYSWYKTGLYKRTVNICKEPDNSKNDLYLKMMVESLGPADEVAERKDMGKIIRSIAKTTIIKKSDLK